VAPTGTFAIDPQRSTLEIRGTSSVHPIHIRARALAGELVFTDGVATGRLVIPAKSLRGDSPLHDFELRRQIQVRRYPTIEATVQRLTLDEAEGEITFFGATNDARGPVSVTVDGDELHIVGESTFDVRAFGFEPPNVLGVKVHPEVNVHVDIVGVRQ
jgi:hypothetical protein